MSFGRCARALVATLAGIATVLALTGGPVRAAAVTITNATQFTDTSGALVHAHGGGVLKVGAYYYWFGENRNADNTFRYVSAYRSTDQTRRWNPSSPPCKAMLPSLGTIVYSTPSRVNRASVSRLASRPTTAPANVLLVS